MRSLGRRLTLALSLAVLGCSGRAKPRLWTPPAYSEQRYSPLTAITAATVDKLGLAWSAEFDTDRGQEATPLMVDGVLYTTSAWSKVFAFDAKTGKPLWSRGFSACCDVVNRGVALWGGKVPLGLRRRDRHAGVAFLHHA